MKELNESRTKDKVDKTSDDQKQRQREVHKYTAIGCAREKEREGDRQKTNNENTSQKKINKNPI